MRSLHKSPPVNWQKQLYLAEKHLPKKAKIRPSYSRSVDFTWQTGIVIWLLLCSNLTSARARSTQGNVTALANTSAAEGAHLTNFIFNTCPVNSALEKPKQPVAAQQLTVNTEFFYNSKAPFEVTQAINEALNRGEQRVADFKLLLEKKESQQKLSKKQKKRYKKYLTAARSCEKFPTLTMTFAETSYSTKNSVLRINGIIFQIEKYSNSSQVSLHPTNGPDVVLSSWFTDEKSRAAYILENFSEAALQAFYPELAALNITKTQAVEENPASFEAICPATTCDRPHFFSNAPEKGVTAKIIQSRIVGNFTQEQQKIVVDKIMDLRTTHPDIKYMIDTVIEQTPGLQILLAPLADIQDHQNEEFSIGGFYDPRLRFIVIPASATAGTILHEFRHAFWHTFHIANSPDQLTIVAQLALQTSSSEAITKYFALGDDRISKILKILFYQNLDEEQAQFFQVDLGPLKRIKKLFESSYKHYSPIYRTNSLIGSETSCENYPAGKPYKNDQSLTVYSCKVASSDEKGSAVSVPAGGKPIKYLHLLTDEPNPLENILRAVLKTVETITKHYSPDAFLYEREACLFGLLPVPMIEELYPELIGYIRNHTKNLSVKRTPFSTTRAPISNLSHYLDTRLRATDIEFIKQLRPEEQLRLASGQANELWAAGKDYYKTLTPILNFLMKLEYKLEEAFERLMSIYCEQTDHENFVDLINRVSKKYGKISLGFKYMRCYIVALYNLGDMRHACEHTLVLLNHIISSFEEMVKTEGLEATSGYKAFCEDMMIKARCK